MPRQCAAREPPPLLNSQHTVDACIRTMSTDQTHQTVERKAPMAYSQPIPISIRLRWHLSRWGSAFSSSRIGMVAGSLAFVSILSLVPITLLSIHFFAALPAFLDVEANLQQWLLANLLPENLTQQVLQTLNRFTIKVDEMSYLSMFLLGIAGIGLAATVENSFNHIWQVKRKRPLWLRVWAYIFLLVLGPLLLGIGIAQSNIVIQALRTYLHWNFLQDAGFLNVQFVLLLSSFILFYKYIPYTSVQWRQAILSAFVAAFGIVLARHVLAWYFFKSAFYTTLYGALAAIPILLIWIYIMWVLLLFGAVLGTQIGSKGGKSKGFVSPPLQRKKRLKASYYPRKKRARLGSAK